MPPPLRVIAPVPRAEPAPSPVNERMPPVTRTLPVNDVSLPRLLKNSVPVPDFVQFWLPVTTPLKIKLGVTLENVVPLVLTASVVSCWLKATGPVNSTP